VYSRTKHPIIIFLCLQQLSRFVGYTSYNTNISLKKIMEVYLLMAGGFLKFSPTLNSTEFVRAAYEGVINGLYDVNVAKAESVNGELAGKFAAIAADGTVTLAGEGAKGAVGLIREDFRDMVNASGKASFYMLGMGGEYHVAESRLGAPIANFTVGSDITTDANGAIVPANAGDKVVGTVVSIGEFRMGNMYEWAGTAANGGNFLGFIMHV
jgi:hypothetical protein